MMAEARTVVAIRTFEIWGVLPASPCERHDILAEEGPAFFEAAGQPDDLRAGSEAAERLRLVIPRR